MGYPDPHEKNFNIATLRNGQLFHWPKDLVSHDDLKRLNPPRELPRLPIGIEDTNQVHGIREKTSLKQPKETKRQRSSSTEDTIIVVNRLLL